MPKKDDTKIPPKAIAKAAKRHLEGGEKVPDLIKEYKVSRATFYNWITRYRRMANASGTEASEPTRRGLDKAALVEENSQLRAEIQRLKAQLFDQMMKGKEA